MLSAFTNITDKDIHAISVAANGNCIFNAISLALTGTENNACILRLYTCLEMVKYRSFYEEMKGIVNSENLLEISPDYGEATCDCAKPGHSSSLWVLMALSTVIGFPITSVFPSRRDSYAPDLLVSANCTFYPRDLDFADSSNKRLDSLDTISVLWTSVSAKYVKVWSPDHFVPLIRCTKGSFIPLLCDNSSKSRTPVRKILVNSNNKYCNRILSTLWWIINLICILFLDSITFVTVLWP